METQYDWIDDAYIARCLKISPLDVIDYRIELAVGKGNNYASKLLRVNVHMMGKTGFHFQKFLIKCLPDGIIKTSILEAGLWDKEIYMYKKVLPLIEIYIGQQIGPKCLNVSNIFNHSSKHKEIVLEDLSSDYKMANRIEQLDYDHSVIVMKAIAKFHAGSVAVKRCYEREINFIGKELCFIDSRRKTNENYIKQPFRYLANDLKNNKELKKYGYYLENFGENFWDLMVSTLKSKGFNVLNHGDLWTNNILFKYDESTGEVIDARFVDFQCCRYTSPAFDLQYFFMSSIKENVRENKLQELVNVYINSLNKELIKLGERRISNNQLDEALSSMDCYGLYSAIYTLPMSIRDLDFFGENEDIFDYNGAGNPIWRCIRNERYQKLVPKILIYFDKKGLFDDNYISDNFGIKSRKRKRWSFC